MIQLLRRYGLWSRVKSESEILDEFHFMSSYGRQMSRREFKRELALLEMWVPVLTQSLELRGLLDDIMAQVRERGLIGDGCDI